MKLSKVTLGPADVGEIPHPDRRFPQRHIPRIDVGAPVAVRPPGRGEVQLPHQPGILLLIDLHARQRLISLHRIGPTAGGRGGIRLIQRRGEHLQAVAGDVDIPGADLPQRVIDLDHPGHLRRTRVDPREDQGNPRGVRHTGDAWTANHIDLARADGRDNPPGQQGRHVG